MVKILYILIKSKLYKLWLRVYDVWHSLVKRVVKLTYVIVRNFKNVLKINT